MRARCDIIDIVDCNVEKEEDVLPEVPCTPSLKQLSFGPHLNSDNFENTLKPAKVSFTRQSYVQSYVLRIAFSPYELRLSKRKAVHTQRST